MVKDLFAHAAIKMELLTRKKKQELASQKCRPP